MSDEIISQQDGPILRITFNRPDHGNGATDHMATELTRLLNSAAEKSRLVVLRGAGKDFCIGRATMGQQPAVMPEALARKRGYDVIFNSYAAIRNTPIPVICVVQGRALGYGCAVAALCRHHHRERGRDVPDPRDGALHPADDGAVRDDRPHDPQGARLHDLVVRDGRAGAGAEPRHRQRGGGGRASSTSRWRTSASSCSRRRRSRPKASRNICATR